MREGEEEEGEDKGEEVEMLEMEESKDGGDLVPSLSNIVPAKTEADNVIVNEEKVEDQLELSVVKYGSINDNDNG